MTPFLAALLQHLGPKGLTQDHISILVDDEYDSPSRILRIGSEQLKKMLGIKGGLAADILDFAEAAKGTDFGKSQAAHTVTIQTILENLIGADPIRTAAVKALRGHQVLFVVIGEDQELLATETMAFLASPDRATAERQGLWKDFALVPVDTFLPDTSPLRSPYSPEPLVEGIDAAGIAWGSISRERLGLAVWAVQEKMDAGRPHAEIFTAFQTDSELYARALKRARAKGVKMEELRELAKAPRSIQRTIAPSAAPLPANRSAALHAILIRCFDQGELRRFAVHSVNFPNHNLPGDTNLSNFAFNLISAMENQGYIDAQFFAELLRERPRSRADIVAVAAKFSIALA